MIQLSFHGGSREVTGACYLLEVEKTKLLVDCGFFQGCDDCEELNFEDFGFDPASLDALCITHAHLDHVGRIPKLMRAGFHGRIFSTAPTRDLARLILEDALSLARREERELYDAHDLERAFASWEALPYYQRQTIGEIEFQFDNAGHILGSSFVEVWAGGKHILFTGDMGNAPSTLVPPPDRITDAEYLIIESTYSNAEHESATERELQLERVVEDAAARGGTLLIPAFATERTQDILHLLNEMVHLRRIPDMPVFVDAPLAIRVTEVYEKYPREYREEIRTLLARHPNLFRFKRLRFTPSTEESKRINEVHPPKVIIAGSGMMTGGRVLHHARRYLADPKSILLVIGYQAVGSLGRRLVDGEKRVKIFGEDVFVEAEIRQIGGFSAHADGPQLFSFVEANRDTLQRVFVVQGEEARAAYFAQQIKDRLGIPSETPLLHQRFTLQ